MKITSRSPLTLLALFGIGCTAVLGYSWATRVEAPLTAQPPEHPTRLAQSEPAPQPAPRPDVAAEETPPSVQDPTEERITPDIVAKWISATQGEDPQARRAAIALLEKAPKHQALPVLQTVLGAGTDEDRQLALTTLRALALRDRDADGGVRDVLRHAIYHGDDASSGAPEAQALLEEIEGDL